MKGTNDQQDSENKEKVCHRLSKMDPFYGETINMVLQESELFRKMIPESNSGSLLRAFSS